MESLKQIVILTILFTLSITNSYAETGYWKGCIDDKQHVRAVANIAPSTLAGSWDSACLTPGTYHMTFTAYEVEGGVALYLGNSKKKIIDQVKDYSFDFIVTDNKRIAFQAASLSSQGKAVIGAKLIFVTKTSGSDLYVDKGHPEASDSSDAGTFDKPFKSLAYAAAVANPGNRVIVKSGTYSGPVIFENSGTADKPIVIEAAANEDVTVKGGGYNGVFYISGKSHITISGFKIQNAKYGVNIENADHIMVSGNDISLSTSSGVRAKDSVNITVDNNKVHNTNSGGIHEMISLINVDGFAVSNNEVYNKNFNYEGKEGIDAKTGSRNGEIVGNTVHDLYRLGIYVDAWEDIDNIQVLRNKVYNCKHGVAVSSEVETATVENVLIANNILFNNRVHGIIISKYVGNGPRRNIRIYNNTTHNNGSFNAEGKPVGAGIYVDKLANAKGIEIVNNIASENYQAGIVAPDAPETVTYSQYNLVVGKMSFDTGVTQVAQILFVDADNVNFQLEEYSPAINRGGPLIEILDDFNQTLRPVGGVYDVGAFESPY